MVGRRVSPTALRRARVVDRDQPARLPGAPPSHRRRKPLWSTYLGITGLLLLNSRSIGRRHHLVQFIEVQRVGSCRHETIDEGGGTQDRRTDQAALRSDVCDCRDCVFGAAIDLAGGQSRSERPETDAAGSAIYPQVQSLYVAFDNGDFHMVTHIIGDKSDAVRKALDAPGDAAFAVETITGGGGGRQAQWSFSVGGRCRHWTPRSDPDEFSIGAGDPGTTPPGAATSSR